MGPTPTGRSYGYRMSNDPNKLAEIGERIRRCAMIYRPEKALLDGQRQAAAEA